MSYDGISIEDLLKRVQTGEIILPAMQRNYVWKEEQICFLFDSLMKDYPIGAFLFWELGADDIKDYKFNKFVKDIDKVDEIERGDYAIPEGYTTIAVLDGQQRITSLLVGLCGSLRTKVKVARKVNGEFPKRYLALNILHPVHDNKDDEYEFAFLSEEEMKANDDTHYWFRVSDMLTKGFKVEDIPEYAFTLEFGASNVKSYQVIIRNLTQLLNCIIADGKLSYYTAKKKSLAEAVDIFERINNKGQPLNGTDLMLSMASAANKTDMQKRIVDAIKQIENATKSDTGFVPDRGFILTAALMATGAESVSTTNRENYSTERITAIIDAWDRIIDAVSNAAVYIEKLGFNGKKLGKSFIHPIVYYFYKLGPGVDAAKRFAKLSPESSNERTNIVQWLLRAQVKRIFDYGITAQLQNIRRVMDSAMVAPNQNAFPLGALMAMGDGKLLEVTVEDVYSISEWKYGDTKLLPLMTVILKGDAQASYDIDHLWPQSKMSTEAKIKKAAGADALTAEQIEFYKSHYNLLPNLQLLRQTPNSDKSDDYFANWLDSAYSDPVQRKNYMEANCIPATEYRFGNFEKFYEKRKKLLLGKIAEYFGVSIELEDDEDND